MEDRVANMKILLYDITTKMAIWLIKWIFKKYENHYEKIKERNHFKT
jgi:hypothetical protein